MTKPRRALPAALLLGLLVVAARTEAATMAFGYLVNRSNDANYEYLETIFPNSFAGAIRNVYRVSVLKPGQINRILEKRKERLEKQYQPGELAALTEKIAADYFIYGSFVTLPNDQIKISLNLYSRGPNKLLSFTNTGKMESEIFRLVDRITSVMVDFLGRNQFFMTRTVPRGSKIGILTNLEGKDLNYVYCAFINGGYRVASIQGNSLDTILTEVSIGHFQYITAAENAYQSVSDPRGMIFLHGPWTGKRYYEEITNYRELYRTFDENYLHTKFEALEKLASYHGIDAVLIIGFNGTRTNAWVRCIDLRSRDLVWMQSNIRGSVPAICGAIIKRMSEENRQK